MAPPASSAAIKLASTTPPWPWIQRVNIKLVTAAALDCINNHKNRPESATAYRAEGIKIER
jgi:hypothetical protein